MMTSTSSSSSNTTADPSFLGGAVYEDPLHEEAIGGVASSAMMNNTDSDSSRSNLNSIFSPARKKTRNEDPVHDNANSSEDCVDDSHTKNDSTSIDFCSQRYLFSYSQDSTSSSLPNYSQTMSQDGHLFTRMSMLNVASSQHSFADSADPYYSGLVNQSCNHSNFSMPFTISNNISQSLFNHVDCNNTTSNNGNQYSSSSTAAVDSGKDSNQPDLTMRNEPVVVDKKSDRSSSSSSSLNKNNNQHPVGSTETEREIDIPAPIRNGFLKGSRCHQERYFEQHIIRTSSRVKQPSKIWIGAFKERPRIVTEYEEIKNLGE